MAGENFVVDVMTHNNVVIGVREPGRKVWVVTLAVGYVLSNQFGVWNPENVGMMTMRWNAIWQVLTRKTAYARCMLERKMPNVVCRHTGGLPAGKVDGTFVL